MDSLEQSLKLWRDKVMNTYKRKELSPGDLSSMFQQEVIICHFSLIIIIKKNKKEN
jgi:hypothetical protein